MKTKHFSLVFVGLFAAINLFAQFDLTYFLPPNARLNPSIPSPKSVLGFEVGEYHATWPQIHRYMEALDQASDRVSIVKIGQTWEKQPLIQLIITSPANHQNLERLRRDHLALMDPATPASANRKDPLVIWLGYSIHGNEPSGANASLAVAYYLAACEDEKIIRLLDQSVILLDPCLNPDGLNRFASFVNTRKSLNNNDDPNSFEFQEPWPGGRSNHYWFDLNRDWLLLQHPETEALVAQFHLWKPNVLTDHHEMGSNSTFFFQPGVPTRNNPLTPQGTYALTQKIGLYHARALDQIGSLYYTEEGFDDFYLGKGSSYPDIHGSIGILFEQASSRGHLRKTPNGPLTFAFTIRNQATVSYSTLDASLELKKELLYHMSDFYRTSQAEAESAPVKGYLFGDKSDPRRVALMIDNLLKHQIRVLSLERPIEVEGEVFEPGFAWFVPSKQPQYKLVKALFETNTRFQDSTFYDVSAWTLPLATGVPYKPVDGKSMAKLAANQPLQSVPTFPSQVSPGESPVGYLIPADPYYLHRALYQILKQGIRVKIAQSVFAVDLFDGRKFFKPGTLFIPAANQVMNGPDLFYTLSREANENSLTLISLPTGYTPDGPDLGSGQFTPVGMPKVLTFGGAGNSGITGEVWHLLDTRFQIPLTIAESRRIPTIDLSQYNVLILNGTYPEFDVQGIERLKEWTRKGGLIIGIEGGLSFLERNGLVKLTPVQGASRVNENSSLRPYNKRSEDRAGGSIPGTIFKATIDTTHPLLYGYSRDEIALFKEGNSFYKTSGDAYENPVVYASEPLLAGYVNQENLGLLRNTSAVQRQSFGSGKIILFNDDPLFRGYWAATHKLFLNSIFWGNL